MLRQRPQFKGVKGVGKTENGVGRGGGKTVLVYVFNGQPR